MNYWVYNWSLSCSINKVCLQCKSYLPLSTSVTQVVKQINQERTGKSIVLQRLKLCRFNFNTPSKMRSFRLNTAYYAQNSSSKHCCGYIILGDSLKSCLSPPSISRLSCFLNLETQQVMEANVSRSVTHTVPFVLYLQEVIACWVSVLTASDCSICALCRKLASSSVTNAAN